MSVITWTKKIVTTMLEIEKPQQKSLRGQEAIDFIALFIVVH